MHEEVAFIAVGLGWSYNDILMLTHHERARWVQQVNRINARHNHELRKQIDYLRHTYGGAETDIPEP